MRILTLILLVAAMLTSCSRNTETGEKNEPATVSAPTPEQVRSEEKASIYLDKIRLFSQTNEFYFYLDTKERLTADEFMALGRKGDSLIYEEDEVARYRFPMELARKHLDMTHVPHEIRIYSEQHQFVSTARLARVEYLIELNEGFVAVYTPDTGLEQNEKGYYCIGPGDVEFTPVTYQELKDEKLSARIMAELGLKPDYVWAQQHVKVQPGDFMFSVIALDEAEKGTLSYLTELRNDKLKVLRHSDDNFVMWDVLPMPIMKNGRPVLLIQIVLPESDALDENRVGVYDGSAYELEEKNLLVL